MSQTGVNLAYPDSNVRPASARAPASYVNYFELGQNPFEFLIDLGQYHPGVTDGAGSIGIHTRLVLTPPYAKMLSDLLLRSVQEHEREYGAIQPIGQESCPFDIILSSLGEFEERARQLRAANGSNDPADIPQSRKDR